MKSVAISIVILAVVYGDAELSKRLGDDYEGSKACGGVLTVLSVMFVLALVLER